MKETIKKLKHLSEYKHIQKSRVAWRRKSSYKKKIRRFWAKAVRNATKRNLRNELEL